MKNILIILAFITSSTLFTACSNSNTTDDFSSPEAAAKSYFNVLKSLNKDSVKSVMLTFDEFVMLKNNKPGFAEGLDKLGSEDAAQYEGVIKETMNTYDRFYGSFTKHMLTPDKFKEASYTGEEIQTNEFNGLELIRIMLDFKTDKDYTMRVTAVKVNGVWKAVDFGEVEVKMGR